MSKKSEQAVNEAVEALRASEINETTGEVSTDILMEQLQDKNFFRNQLNESFSRYLFDGNYNALFRTLDLMVRSQYTINEFCEISGVGKTKLYQMFTCTSVPKFDTVMKVLKVLGHDIKIV